MANDPIFEVTGNKKSEIVRKELGKLIEKGILKDIGEK